MIKSVITHDILNLSYFKESYSFLIKKIKTYKVCERFDYNFAMQSHTALCKIHYIHRWHWVLQLCPQKHRLNLIIEETKIKTGTHNRLIQLQGRLIYIFFPFISSSMIEFANHLAWLFPKLENSLARLQKSRPKEKLK